VGQSEDGHVESSLSFESNAYIILGDLLAVKRVLPALRDRAAIYPGWMPNYLFVDGAHEALRGDLPKALELTERAVTLMRPGEHAVWALAEARVAQLLIAAGRASEARDRTKTAVEVALERPMIPAYAELLEASLAHAEACVGEHDAATSRISGVVRRAEA